VDKLDLKDPVFATYVIAATIMILKAVSMSWLTVLQNDAGEGRFSLARRYQEDAP
jgi:glutathione S-transferase